MKGRTTVFLLLGILVLGAFIWLQESWRVRSAAKQLERIRLFNLDIDTLLSIEFRLTNGVVVCSKESGAWMAGNPESGMGRADDALVQHMVGGLNSMGKGTTITAKHLEIRGLDESEYGFDRPTVEITAVDNHGRHQWLVGRKTPLGEMVYAKQADGNDIYTLPSKLLEVVPVKASFLRDRVLFPGEASGVRRIELRSETGFVQLIKDAETGWNIQQPIVAQADPKEVEAYIESLYRLRIEDFVADNVSDFSVYGLQGENKQISLGVADGSSRMLVIGDAIPDRVGFVYARRADDTSVFALREDVVQLLNVPRIRFRDARVLPMSLNDISSVAATRGSEQLQLAREQSGQWMIKSPVDWTADARAVAELVMLWGGAVITDFDVQAEVDAPEWTFTFGSEVAGVTNVIEVFAPKGKKDGLLIRRDHDSTVLQINLAGLDEGLIETLRYKDRRVWQFNPDEIHTVKVMKNGAACQTFERQPDDSFAVVETNANLRVDNEAFDLWVRRMARVETSGYIALNPRDLEIYGLERPAIEFQIGLSGSNEIGRVLMVGRETTDGYYSMIKGRDVVFYLKQPVVEALNADVVFADETAVPGAE
jgi:hypothetical protein